MLLMQRRSEGWLAAITMFLALTFFGFPSETKAADKKRIALLSAEASHARVVDELANVAWNRSSDLELLLFYCGSQFAINDQAQTCVLSRDSLTPAVDFADALWKTWSGRIKSARATFSGLRDNPEWNLWGETGFLEIAQYTDNYQELAALLRRQKRAFFAGGPVYRHLYERYYLIHLENTLDWAGLAKLLSRYSLKQIVSDPVKFSAKGKAFFITGNKAELEKLLNAVPSDLRNTTAYAIRKAEYAVLKQGIAESKVVLRKFSNLRPADTVLTLEEAYIDILDSSPAVANAAMEKMVNIAESSPNHVRLLLGMSVTLASYHKPEESGRIFKSIKSRDDLSDFAAFHTLSAWNAVYAGEVAKARGRLNTVLKMAPEDVGANWLKALIAKRQADPKSGAEALATLIEADPYNENYKSLVRYFWERFRTAELQQLNTRVNNADVRAPESLH